MQELQRRQKEQQKFQDLIKEGAGKSIEERVEYNKDLEYNKHANLFAVSYSTIHKAACDGSVSGIKYFMQLKTKPRIKIDDLDKFGLRPIHYAAERGYNDAIKTMFEFKCPVDAPTTDGMTAIMYASKDGRIDTMRLLFENKANLQAVNRAGMSIAHFAAQNDFVEVFALLIEMNIAQKEEILKMIEGAELQSENAPLAAAQGKAGSEKEIKKSKSQASKKPTDSDDSEEEEEEESQADEASLATPSKPLDDDDEDIDEAERMRRAFRTVLNLPDTAIIDIPSKNGTRPLHIAATYNAMRVVHFLSEHGADINALDSAGESPLHKAARKSNYDAYRALLKADAHDSIRNLARETPKELLADQSKS